MSIISSYRNSADYQADLHYKLFLKSKGFLHLKNYSQSSRNKYIYHNLARQFYTARLSTKIFAAFAKNLKQNSAIYRLASVLSSNLHRLFIQFTNSAFCSLPFQKPVPHPADFSFSTKSFNQTLEKLMKNCEKFHYRSSFDKLKAYFEELSTSRIPGTCSLTYSEEMVEKTENISKRIHGIINKITEKEKVKKEKKLLEDQKRIPKLKIAKVIMQDPRKKKDFIMENRCKELQDDLNNLCQHESKAKVLRAWKGFLFARKEKQLKVKTLVDVRFFRMAKKIFQRVLRHTKEKQIKKAKLEIAQSFLAVNFLRKGMIGLHLFQVKMRRLTEKLQARNWKVMQELFLALKKHFLCMQVKKLKIQKSSKKFSQRLLGKTFKELKIRAKEIQLKKNHDELVRVFVNDKLLCTGFKAWIKGNLVFKEKEEKTRKAFRVYSFNAKKKFLQAFKAACLIAIKHKHIKALSILHFSTKNKQKFIENLQSLVKVKRIVSENERKAEIFHFLTLTQKVIKTWYTFSQVYREKRLQKYKSFLIHCKKLIEKSFYGWKKQYPRERYKRLRTLRLENKIDWNIIDSYFCEWIRLAAIRVKFSNDCIRNYKLKVLKKHFSALKQNRLKKFGKKQNSSDKIKKVQLKKKLKFFSIIKKYYLVRSEKNEQKYSADKVYINKIFKKWNKLGKIKAYLKYLTKYHYSKYLFMRWKDYSIEASLMKFAKDHNQQRLKLKTFKYFKSLLQKHQILTEKLNSYLYYKELKTIGTYFDTMLTLSIYKDRLDS